MNKRISSFSQNTPFLSRIQGDSSKDLVDKKKTAPTKSRVQQLKALYEKGSTKPIEPEGKTSTPTVEGVDVKTLKARHTAFQTQSYEATKPSLNIEKGRVSLLAERFGGTKSSSSESSKPSQVASGLHKVASEVVVPPKSQEPEAQAPQEGSLEEKKAYEEAQIQQLIESQMGEVPSEPPKPTESRAEVYTSSSTNAVQDMLYDIGPMQYAICEEEPGKKYTLVYLDNDYETQYLDILKQEDGSYTELGSRGKPTGKPAASIGDLIDQKEISGLGDNIFEANGADAFTEEIRAGMDLTPTVTMLSLAPPQSESQALASTMGLSDLIPSSSMREEGIPEDLTLSNHFDRWEDLSDEEVCSQLDLQAVEAASIFALALHASSRSPNEFALTPDAETGKLVPVLIGDKGAFPSSNMGINNPLSILPIRDQPLSEQAIEQIEKAGDEAFISQQTAAAQGSPGALRAVNSFRERVSLMRTLVESNPGLTLGELEIRLRTLPTVTVDYLSSLSTVDTNDPATFIAETPLSILKEIQQKKAPVAEKAWAEDYRSSLRALGPTLLGREVQQRRAEVAEITNTLVSSVIPSEQEVESALARIETQLQNASLSAEDRQALEAQKDRFSIYQELREPGLTLEPCEGGMGGAYFVKDTSGKLRFILKPLDEDFGCFNNRKGEAIPLKDARIKRSIPPLHTAQAEGAASELSIWAGISQATPSTVTTTHESASFYDVSEEKGVPKGALGEAVKLKACSVQRAVSGAVPFDNGRSMMELADISSDYLGNYEATEAFFSANIDFDNFLEVELITWITYQNDAHTGNVFITRKEEGSDQLHLQIGDFGLSLGEGHSEFRDEIAHSFPQGQLTLPQHFIDKILELDVESGTALVEKYGLGHEAFRERMLLLKEIVQIPGVTAQQVSLRLQILGMQDEEFSSAQQAVQAQTQTQAEFSHPRALVIARNVNTELLQLYAKQLEFELETD